MQETWVRSVGQEDPLEKEMATHSSTLVWKIPWMEKSRDIALPTKVHLVKAMVFPVVMYGCESWTVLKQVLCHKASAPHGKNLAPFAPTLRV